MQVSLAALLIAIGVVLSPFTWFQFLTTKANPLQHAINAVAGVILGPIWAIIIASIIGILRISLGVGTIYAFPGGLPGGFIVGLFYWALRKLKMGKKSLAAALTEPIGTVIIGGTLALYIVAPWIGDQKMLAKLEMGHWAALTLLWSGWAASSIPGSIIGFLVLLALDKSGLLEELEKI